METYLTMLYISREQEVALKDLFLGRGWPYSKLDMAMLTDKIGPAYPGTSLTLCPNADAGINFSPIPTTTIAKPIQPTQSFTTPVQLKVCDIAGLGNEPIKILPKVVKIEEDGGDTETDHAYVMTDAQPLQEDEQDYDEDDDYADELAESNADGSDNVDPHHMQAETRTQRGKTSKRIGNIAAEAIIQEAKRQKSGESAEPDEASLAAAKIWEDGTCAISPASMSHSSEQKPVTSEGEAKEINDAEGNNDEENPVVIEAIARVTALAKILQTSSGKDSKTVKCPHCTKIYSKLNIKRHMLTHIDMPYKCGRCSVFFHQQKLLDKHMEERHANKDFVCTHCGIRYKSSMAVKEHIQIKHSENPWSFTCDVCQKGFNRLSHYKDHMNVHNQVNPHVCNNCNRSYKNRSAFSRHVSECGKNSKYPCEHCGMIYKTKHSLHDHVKREHSSVGYRCQCGSVFRNRSTRMRHRKRCAMFQALNSCADIEVCSDSGNAVSESLDPSLGVLCTKTSVIADPSEAFTQTLGTQIQSRPTVINNESCDTHMQPVSAFIDNETHDTLIQPIVTGTSMHTHASAMQPVSCISVTDNWPNESPAIQIQPVPAVSGQIHHTQILPIPDGLVHDKEVTVFIEANPPDNVTQLQQTISHGPLRQLVVIRDGHTEKHMVTDQTLHLSMVSDAGLTPIQHQGELHNVSVSSIDAETTIMQHAGIDMHHL